MRCPVLELPSQGIVIAISFLSKWARDSWALTPDSDQDVDCLMRSIRPQLTQAYVAFLLLPSLGLNQTFRPSTIVRSFSGASDLTQERECEAHEIISGELAVSPSYG